MAHLHQSELNVQVSPSLPPGTRINVSFSNLSLLLRGCNLPVEISTATADRQPPNPISLRNILVMAHLDTGASITSIDIGLANYLNLVPTGEAFNQTAAGSQSMPTYVIDLSFPNTNLRPFADLNIGSCRLNFNLQSNMENPNNPLNFGVLLGRDVLTRWNLVWNGPTSTIIISD